jgi:hypothetical protein
MRNDSEVKDSEVEDSKVTDDEAKDSWSYSQNRPMMVPSLGRLTTSLEVLVHIQIHVTDDSRTSRDSPPISLSRENRVWTTNPTNWEAISMKPEQKFERQGQTGPLPWLRQLALSTAVPKLEFQKLQCKIVRKCLSLQNSGTLCTE